MGLFIPAPARRSDEMGAGRFGGGFDSSPPLIKAPRANVKVLSFFLRFSSSIRSASDGCTRTHDSSHHSDSDSGA